MTIFRHEMRQGRLSLLIWTACIGLLMAVCVLLYPEMKGEMDQLSSAFASMGGFTQAFGMDRLDFGSLIGFYGIECGNILGLGGAFFASLMGISVLCKEEREHTAEFLLTHPVTRTRVLAEKLAAVMAQVLLLNAAVLVMALLSITAIGEEIPVRELALMHAAFLLMQVELAALCFGLSAFLRRGSLGAGLGLASGMYFLNLIANIAPSAKWLKVITPFGYTESADIVTAGHLDAGLIALGAVYSACALAAAFWYYRRKDIT